MDTIVAQLNEAANTHGHFQVWKHDNIPKKFHYNNPRVGRILLLADLYWMFEITRVEYDPTAAHFPKGVHGYDVNSPDMHAIFIAQGPYFSINEKYDDSSLYTKDAEISNVEVYPLLASILKIQPLGHNGTGVLIPSTMIY